MKRDREEIGAKAEEIVDGGAWRRGRLIGEGAYGTIHLARFPIPAVSARFESFPPVAAVKSTYSSIRELETEKWVYEALGESPYILRCLGDDVTVGKNGRLLLNLFLEYVPGGTLYEVIRKREGLGLVEAQARRLTRSILLGVRHIHERGFVHCDLKPENVFMVEEGAKIGDFGSAKDWEDWERFVEGTEMYLAPESFQGGLQEQPSDIWALGCLVFAMLTGTLHWEVSPSVGAVAASPEAHDFLRKCLSPNPNHRPTAAMLLTHPFVTGFEEEQRPDHKRLRP